MRLSTIWREKNKTIKNTMHRYHPLIVLFWLFHDINNSNREIDNKFQNFDHPKICENKNIIMRFCAKRARLCQSIVGIVFIRAAIALREKKCNGLLLYSGYAPLGWVQGLVCDLPLSCSQRFIYEPARDHYNEAKFKK